MTLLTETERVTDGIGMDDPDAARLLDQAGQGDCTKLCSSETGNSEVRHGQVEMKLLRRTMWPFRRRVWRCQLEGQLERRISEVYLAPFGISEIRLPI